MTPGSARKSYSRLNDMIKYIILCVSFVLGILNASGQSNITFRHLNTSHGLSYLGVVDMCTDKKGNLWISTANGLNMYNGTTIEKYFATEYPQLQNSNVMHVACDAKNRVWVQTVNGNITIIDEKRKFHRAGLYENGEFIKARWILETGDGKLILFSANGHYELAPKKPIAELDSLTLDHFTRIEIEGFDTLQKMFYKQVFYYDEDNYLFVQEDAFYKVNYQTRRVEGKFDIPHCTMLTKIGDASLMVYDREAKEVKIIDLTHSSVTYPFRFLKDQNQNPVTAPFLFAEKVNTDQYVMTTENAGIYIYDHKNQKLYNHTHHFADPSSVSANITSTIEVTPSGWVFIACTPAGISYYNSREIVSSHDVFFDTRGNGYDGHIAGIATKDNQSYYMGTSQGLLEWNRNTNNTQFLHYKDKDGGPLPSPQEIGFILIDSLDQIWVTTQTQGLFVLDKNKKLIRHITASGPKRNALKMGRVNRLLSAPDGYIWACGRNGICRINPSSFVVDHFENEPLAYYDSLFVTMMLFTDKDNLWVAISSGGVSHFNLVSNEVRRITVKEGLVHNGVFDIGADYNKNVYVGTRAGLNILFSNGHIKTITQKDGLLMNRVEGLLLDQHNRMWIGNDIGLACYTPEDSSLTTYDTRHGLSIYGFRVGSYFKMPNGEFMLGTPRGVQYFHPDSLFNKKIEFTTLIHKIETGDIVTNISETPKFSLSPTDRQVTFYFSTIDFSPNVRTYYEYKLSGIDPDWIQVVDQNSVRYNSLPPGDFTFQVRVSNDNKNWQNAENEVFLHIAAPFYLRWWFQVSGVLLLAGLVILVIRQVRSKQNKQREQMETEIVFHYFASQINRHKKVNELLWDVAKNCISKLKLEECVIYMVDPERNVLVQTAAYGPKNPKENTILKPIEIPIGQGITGTVAKTKVAEIINNTEKDPRYIVDDDRRYSEITVPLIVDGQVIGVIDSEHSQKNFFTQKHMSLLTAIAVLSANQIQRIRAEEEKQKAQIEVLQNKQKATESRLQSLRLQMNPHFLFNALNSIQQMILANEEMVATKYLSRFSKLLRSILIHSDKESISLREELDILKLYVELESVRFKEAFSYEIECDEEIDTEEVKIPTLLIQPFVENAIWHGLMHKEGKRHLKITFTDEGDFVRCIVEDNGIGRQKARELKISTGQDKKHTSKGIEVSLERLNAMQRNGGRTGSMQIIDMMDMQGNATGTRVEINLPIQN